MFAWVNKVRVKRNNVDVSVKLYRDSVIPAAKSHKGFRGAYLLTNRKTGKGIFMTLWDSEEDAVSNEQSGYYKEPLSKFKEYFTTPPVCEGYEVTVQA